MLRKLILLPALWIPFSVLAQGFSLSMDDSSVRYRMIKDVAVLASDSLNGREAGTDGEHKAAKYLSMQFTAMGLLPRGEEEGSFYQHFSKFQVGYNWSTKLVVNGVSYPYRKEFGITALSMNGNGRGTLVNAIQGLVIPEKKIDQLLSLGDLKGKFVLVNLHVPDTLTNDTALSRKLTPAFRMMTVLNRGARGVIFWNPDSPWFDELFDFQSSDTLPGLALYVNRRTAECLMRLHEAPTEVCVHIDRKTNTFTNVVGYLDNHAGRTIVIGAHFDHLGGKNGGSIFYGADDNASGTAGILELARYFASHRDTMNNYLFIGFTAEEKGLWGSDYFIKHPAVPLPDITYMLNLDMIGRLGSCENTIEIEAMGSSTEWGNILRATSHPAFRIKRIGASLPYSDHDPFYRAGIPALCFTTGLHDDYHTVRDRAETLNYNGMVELMKFARELIVNASHVSSIPYRKVPFMTRASASVGFFFEALGWVFTARN